MHAHKGTSATLRELCGLGDELMFPWSAPQSNRKFQFPRLPAHGLALVLLDQPTFEGREVVANGGGVHLPLAGNGLERIGPGAAQSHLEHRVQALSGFLASVD